MKFGGQIQAFFDIRPGEKQPLAWSILGSFFMISFVVLARAGREAVYLSHYSIESLPQLKAIVSLLTIPAIAFFLRYLSRHDPRITVRKMLGGAASILILFWFLGGQKGEVIIGFYILTAITTVLMTSGFWVIMAETFHLREAKRLFAFVAAGGPAGAVCTGTALGWIQEAFHLMWLIPILFLFLMIVFFAICRLKSTGSDARRSEEANIFQGLGEIRKRKHLRLLALIVMTSAIASSFLDFQFLDWSRKTFSSTGELGAFFGAFYGWSGGMAVAIQLLFAPKIMKKFGVAASLSILPTFLIAGSAGLFLFPSLICATLARGSDHVLRISLHRSAMEVLYLPLPSLVRRKTKTLIDSGFEQLAEGLGYILITFWLLVLSWPSGHITILVTVFGLLFLGLSLAMNQSYLRTISRALVTRDAKVGNIPILNDLQAKDLLSATVTRLDLRDLFGSARSTEASNGNGVGENDNGEDVFSQLRSKDPQTVLKTLQEHNDWNESHTPDLIRLLAQDRFRDEVSQVLISLANDAASDAINSFADQKTDFVIRRRLPRILAEIHDEGADGALLGGLADRRFEVRYRSAIGLKVRRKRSMPVTTQDWKAKIWQAIENEVGRGKPVWEMQRVLDESETEIDDLIQKKIGARQHLSMEHTFRLLTLVLPEKPTQAAFYGIVGTDKKMRSFALEYLEQTLPRKIREKLWPFIGDVSEMEKIRSTRNVNEIVSDLLQTGATLFGSTELRDAFEKATKREEEN